MWMYAVIRTGTLRVLPLYIMHADFLGNEVPEEGSVAFHVVGKVSSTIAIRFYQGMRAVKYDLLL